MSLAAFNQGQQQHTPPMKGLRLWNRAHDIAGNDGDSISAWADKSGFGNDGFQADSTRQPTLKKNIVNGFPVVRFYATADGTLDNITYPDFCSGFSAAHIFIVVKVAIEGVGLGLWKWSSDNCHYPWSSGIIYDDFGASVRKTTVDPTPSLAAWRIYEVSAGAGSWTNYLDGAQLDTTATNTVAFNTAPKIGSDAIETYGLIGDVAEVIMYNEQKNQFDRTQICRYLGNKYNITVP